MKNLGYLLLTAGFLGGSYFAVLDAESVPVGTFLPMFVVGIIGVVLARIATDRFLGRAFADNIGIPVAAGLIVGEALIGVGFAFWIAFGSTG